ncbi:protein kinase domain-containing protein [Sclerotinia borealis F-4128]|uniref:EKC/KEOPS complex subunit BUD32 n=1 Tax=Sclerotinia borealis (strain F-4128) TaxID=1432307 RepID=W9CM71_SCLBF|nr:protein kinase domain-containing protein [Sclerotinia borealis F-4128]
MIQANNQELPVPGGVLIARGATGWVYKINNRIALKIPRKGSHEEFACEVKFYNILESHSPPCPDISRSFLRVPKGNFMAFCSGGSLDQRLQEHQTRGGKSQQFKILGINKCEPLHLVEQWAAELSSAVAWLESLGYCHTDIRPANLLFDEQDHIKLTDFDCWEEVGSPALGSAPPWARVLGPEAGSDCGSFGYNGARVEQFAIGSVLYMMTRGHEPYEDGTCAPEESSNVVDLLQQMRFPSLGEGVLDNIIDRCWNGGYPLLKDLADETKLLSRAHNIPRAVALTEEYCKEIQEECQQLIESGLLEGIKEGSLLI